MGKPQVEEAGPARFEELVEKCLADALGFKKFHSLASLAFAHGSPGRMLSGQQLFENELQPLEETSGSINRMLKAYRAPP